MKAKYPVFYCLDLDGGILKLIYLKIRKADLYENRNGQNLHCFEKFFSLKPSEQLWNHGPGLSTQYCQEGTRPRKKVKNTENSEVNSSFSIGFLIRFSNFTSLEPVNIHYSGTFYCIFIVFRSQDN